MGRILLDTGLGKGPEEYGNMGDVSMLQVAVDRLRRVFPDSSIEVLTDSAENLARFCPGATPVANTGRALWFADGVMLGRFGNHVPRRIVDLLVGLKRLARSRYPGLVERILLWRLKDKDRLADAEAVKAFLRALQSADLLLISGAGGFYDGCRDWNLEILDLVEAALERKIPVAMLGQGFGPLTDPAVCKRAAHILPRVDYITVRGGRDSGTTLCSLGVPASKVETTGDEAVELAFEARSGPLGHGLGINLRYAASATTNDQDLARIRSVLQDFARRYSVPLIPLPIAIQIYTRDDLAIKELLAGFDDQSDGGKSLDTPQKVIQQAGRCRVVVTGAYHAAVFALAQGIPVVALAKSAYFANKLLGLQDQFGEGCQTLLLAEPALPERLRAAIERAWQKADELHEALLVEARRQVDLSRDSYQHLKGLAPFCTNAKAHHANSPANPGLNAMRGQG